MINGASHFNKVCAEYWKQLWASSARLETVGAQRLVQESSEGEHGGLSLFKGCRATSGPQNWCVEVHTSFLLSVALGAARAAASCSIRGGICGALQVWIAQQSSIFLHLLSVILQTPFEFLCSLLLLPCKTSKKSL